MINTLNMNRTFRNKSVRALASGAGLILVLTLSGCGREDVKVYRVAKDQPNPATAAPGGMPAGHPAVGGPAQAQLTWKTPDGWNELQPGGMRVASFKITGNNGKQADVSIIPLRGGAGGDFANVNLWRDQVSLPPVTAEELAGLVQPVAAGGLRADLYELPGKSPENGEPTRILGAIQHREDTDWFFKMTGDDQLVAEQKPAFIEFLKSIAFGAGAAPAHPPMESTGLPAMPAGHPDVSTAAAAGAPSSEGKPNWQAPADWKEVPGGQFLVAKFAIAGNGGAQAAVNVSSSPGDGGGLLANVNRWRQQLKLAPVDEAELGKLTASIDLAGGKAILVDLSGTDVRTGQPSRVVGVMVPQAAQTWFYKLMGDTAVVEAQKDAFTKFVQAVKY